MALVLFFLAVGYANNLVYIFFFFLVSVALTSVLITNKNVDGVEVENISAEPVFAGEEGSLNLVLINYSKSPAWELEFFLEKNNKTFLSSLEPNDDNAVSVTWVPSQRGLVKVPRLYMQSYFPFGLLRAWKVFKDRGEVLVFPSRQGDKEFPRKSYDSTAFDNTGVFRDHRLFQGSDSLTKIDWRASARRQELLVKNFEESEKPSLHFSWRQTEHLADAEARLSQLALWVDEAERQGHSYSLSVGSFQSSLNRGPDHWRGCLEYLARVNIGELS